MNKEEKDHLLKVTIKEFGHWPQIDMLREEMGEVLQAINKLKRTGMCEDNIRLPSDVTFNTSTSNYEHNVYCERFFSLCSEFADLEIMLEQMRKIFSEEAIELAKERKLDKHLNNMIKKGFI
jgi:NTP pyrophosphatase (non-canonical NTP hydrolase)